MIITRVSVLANRILPISGRCYTKGPPLKILKRPVDSVFERLNEKILYSSYFEDNVLKLGYHRNQAMQNSIRSAIEKEQIEARKIQEFPVALRHLNQDLKNIDDLTRFNHQTQIVNNTVVLDNTPVAEDREMEESLIQKPLPIGKNWMEDYEFYVNEKKLTGQEEDDDDLDEDAGSRYGTPDPKVPPSRVPCSGCGARLHCMDESLPGYLPSEIFKGRTKDELNAIICQRCHFLKHYNTALNISVKPEEYEQFLSTIKNRPGLMILIVDLLDLPCSIWPNILDLVGHDRPMFIVGNKVDLIPKDSRGYLNHIKSVLEEQVLARGIPERNIRHVSLISATTGYGIEELVTALHNKWSRDGDVYLCGVTNVGKSSLFNSLLKSDYCKSKASDLMQRATASPWPGTTIKMLKFPILRISDSRKYWRTMRLISEQASKQEEQRLRKIQATETGKVEHATLLGHIGQSFKEYDEDQANSFSMGQPQKELFALDPSHKEFSQSKWCYDTPGVITHDQMYSLFSIEELMLVKQSEMMRPRTYLMKPGMSLFLAGIARIDFKEVRIIIKPQLLLFIDYFPFISGRSLHPSSSLQFPQAAHSNL